MATTAFGTPPTSHKHRTFRGTIGGGGGGEGRGSRKGKKEKHGNSGGGGGGEVIGGGCGEGGRGGGSEGHFSSFENRNDAHMSLNATATTANLVTTTTTLPQLSSSQTSFHNNNSSSNYSNRSSFFGTKRGSRTSHIIEAVNKQNWTFLQKLLAIEEKHEQKKTSRQKEKKNTNKEKVGALDTIGGGGSRVGGEMERNNVKANDDEDGKELTVAGPKGRWTTAQVNDEFTNLDRRHNSCKLMNNEYLCIYYQPYSNHISSCKFLLF